MAYDSHLPFRAPHAARIPERFTQAGVLVAAVAVVVPLAIIDRIFNRAALER